MKRLLALIVWVVLGLSPLLLVEHSYAQLVRSQLDFEIHIVAHKTRVIEGGLLLKQLHPDVFGDLSDDLIRDYLVLHDANKVRTPGSDPKKLQKALWKIWGKDIKTLARPDREKAYQINRELNSHDHKLAHAFFREHGMLSENGSPNDQAKLLKKIENIADQVDRGLDPVAEEEFGRKMTLASQYLKDPLDQKLAISLEHNYDSVTKDYSFERLRFAEACVISRLLNTF